MKGEYTIGNADNLDEAINALNTFTKNWCMNCFETNQLGEPCFMCDDCEFQMEDGVCLVKRFAIKKGSRKIGCMGMR